MSLKKMMMMMSKNEALLFDLPVMSALKDTLIGKLSGGQRED